LIQRSGQVKTGVTVNMIHGNHRTQVTYQGSIAEYDGKELNDNTIRKYDHVHLAGVYVQTNLRPQIKRILETAKDLGISSSLDPQWDPSEKWEYLDEWLPLLNYFFVNEHEMLSITKSSELPKACNILNEKTNCPVVKTGEKGAMLFIDGHLKIIPSFKVNVSDTTGAGDSFNAGFIFANLEKQWELEKSCRFANAAGARSCTFVGGVNARSTYKDIMNFMEAGS